MTVKLIWVTPDAEALIGYMARVSNPANQNNPSVEGLIRYMIRNEHWSPFEMVSMCVEIETTRDIARQILRHRSFSFQEFSQRYADASALGYALRETRMQDHKNRQNSVPCDNVVADMAWKDAQRRVMGLVESTYKWALERGIAKEVARAILPEGLTKSRMYMSGTLRSWLHYVGLRTGNGTQLEHQIIASEIESILAVQFPTVWKAFNDKSE